MLRSPTNSRAVANAILRVGQMVSGPGLAGGLTWAQWTALRYLARANSLSCTPSLFAAFHGTTRGTASQTIKSLIAGGYVVRTRSTADGRSARLDLAPTQRHEAGAALIRLIASLARRRDAPPFGSCGDCRDRGDPHTTRTARRAANAGSRGRPSTGTRWSGSASTSSRVAERGGP